ncbi:hypothetical protein JYU34_001722 [Plutella xylostella]|uniref:Uncharacterized protein n=1 Tax=Plutella xylostella TaxID=51655 RepID=A0ABQ7R4M4_PLUXY|nr:hypothetical protein JYU34_001722 [Plutella xylostella]
MHPRCCQPWSYTDVRCCAPARCFQRSSRCCSTRWAPSPPPAPRSPSACASTSTPGCCSPGTMYQEMREREGSRSQRIKREAFSPNWSKRAC